MQHPEALRVIRSLGPELAKQAAEDVLLQHAAAEDLAPAQLEKLAQAYNMIRQLSHIDKAEDRGSSCHQIDTPELLRTYAHSGEKAAAATPVRFGAPTHDPSVDLMRALRREMSPVVKAAACDQPGTVETSRPSVPPPSPEADVRFTVEQLKEAAWEAKVELYLVADEILKMASVEGRYLQLAVAEQDAMRQVNPLCVSESLNWLAKYAGQQRLSRLLTRHEGPVKAAAFTLTSPLADKLVEFANAFTLTSMFHKLASGAGIALGDMPKSDAVNEQGQTAADLAVMDLLDAAPDPTTETNTDPIGDEAQDAPLETAARKAREESDTKGAKGGGKGGGGKSNDKAGDKASPPKGSHWLSSIISGATKPVSAVSNTVAAAGSSAQGHMKMITDKERVHKAQIKSDASVADIKRSILIRRLAANDPVLRDMPLPQVLETYNAIAESNPEVASNPRRILLAMREAASYEGVTLDAQKQLGDIRGAAAKTDQAESDNTKRRYTS